MLDVVDALEVLGSDADLAGAASATVEAMLRREGVDPVLRSALLTGDSRALHALARAPGNVCCLINPAEEDEEQGSEEEGEEGEDDADAGDDLAPRTSPEPRRR